jgi:CheY-like chemotaxis protein
MRHATKPKILIVDDEPVIVFTLAVILEQEGYQTAAAQSGEEAVQLARSFQPDLLLTDVVMGGLNGVEAAIRIVGFLPQCKVLLISGTAAHKSYLAEARERGFDFELLEKPISPPNLLENIRQVLANPVSQAAD